MCCHLFLTWKEVLLEGIGWRADEDRITYKITFYVFNMEGFHLGKYRPACPFSISIGTTIELGMACKCREVLYRGIYSCSLFLSILYEACIVLAVWYDHLLEGSEAWVLMVLIDSLWLAKVQFHGQKQLCLVTVMLPVIVQSSDRYSRVDRIGTSRKVLPNKKSRMFL